MKIKSLSELIKLRQNVGIGKKVVLATGVFDILHIEHLRFLKKAKKEGNILIIGIESDKRVRKLKGKGRPINSQQRRAKVIAALNMVDYLFILPENLGGRKAREELIKTIKPDIYAVSSNTPFQQEKQRIMKKFKGELKIIHPHNPQISTTKILTARDKLIKR